MCGTLCVQSRLIAHHTSWKEEKKVRKLSKKDEEEEEDEDEDEDEVIVSIKSPVR